MNKDTADFVIYIINEIANRQDLSTARVYHILDEVGCIQHYLVPYYDVLHTMGTEAIVDDVLRYVKNRKKNI